MRISCGRQDKRVLLLDDAVASGGTLRVAASFCHECGASSVHGLGLKIIGGYWEPPTTNGAPPPSRRRARELKLPAFTPWGTF